MTGTMLRGLARLLVVAALIGSSACGRTRSPSVPLDDGLTPRLSASAIQPRSDVGTAARPVPGTGTTEEASAYRLRGGDPLVIFLRGIGPKDETIEDKIDENGYIDLPYIGPVLGAGRTQYQLEKAIQTMYLDRQIYRHVSVSVVMPSQGYFIRGEVRQPGRFPIITGVTLMQGIATAGGFSEFAQPKKVRLIRGGQVTTHNVLDIERHPEKDVLLESGDVIVVDRSLL